MTKWVGTSRYNKSCEMQPCKRNAIHQQATFTNGEWVYREVCLDHKIELDGLEQQRKIQELGAKIGYPIQDEELIKELLEENNALKVALAGMFKDMDYNRGSNTFRGQRVVTWDTFHAALDHAKTVLGIDLRTCLGER